MFTLELTVNGMTCTGCSGRLQRVLENTDGIIAASVVLESKQANVQYNAAEIQPDAIKSVIVDAGFSVERCEESDRLRHFPI